MNNSILEEFTINLSEKAKNNKLDPVIGRDKQIKRVSQILLKRTKNNPILLGNPGVGKTAIAEELAIRINEGKVHDDLLDKKVLLLDLAGILAGTKERGSFEQRVTDLLEDIRKDENIILMIDEIHTILSIGNLSGGTSQGSMNLANLFKPSLARGEIRCIGATTSYEYSKYFTQDAALDRRFQPVEINEPSNEETIDILKGLKYKYEEYHNLKISDNAIKKCVEFSSKYMPYRYFPDKAIDILDEACSYTSMRKKKLVSGKIINKILKTMIKFPDKKVLLLEEKLKKNIIGQNHVTDSLIKVIKRYECGFYRDDRPIASMMFIGPTGTGKTETVKLLSKYYLNSMFRLDMSEYMERFDVSKLIGAPPGYIGYDEGGILTNFIKYNPCSVILFDEIEKAHHDIFNILLQILEDGVLTDSYGNKFSFKQSIIIMTSNVGYSNNSRLGFDLNEKVTCIYNRMKYLEELKYTFKPEFLNRIDHILAFDYLTFENIRKISDNMIYDIIEDMKIRGIDLHIKYETRKLIYNHGIDTGYGARPIRNAINKIILDEIAETLLNETDHPVKFITI